MSLTANEIASNIGLGWSCWDNPITTVYLASGHTIMGIVDVSHYGYDEDSPRAVQRLEDAIRQRLHFGEEPLVLASIHGDGWTDIDTSTIIALRCEQPHDAGIDAPT